MGVYDSVRTDYFIVKNLTELYLRKISDEIRQISNNFSQKSDIDQIPTKKAKILTKLAQRLST